MVILGLSTVILLGCGGDRSFVWVAVSVAVEEAMMTEVWGGGAIA